MQNFRIFIESKYFWILLLFLLFIIYDTAPTQILKMRSDKGCGSSPDAIVIGTKKAGTEAMLLYFSAHPQVRQVDHEIHYFDKLYNYFIRGKCWYESQFNRTSPTEFLVEKSPSYFRVQPVASRVKKQYPDVKLILNVREPVERIISDYAMLMDRGYYYHGSLERLVFDHRGEVDPLSPIVYPSLYAYHVERWLEYFPPNQLLVMDVIGQAKKSKENLISELQAMENFLKIDSFYKPDVLVFNKQKGFYCLNQSYAQSHNACLSSSKGRKHPVISEKTREKLDRFFRTKNEEFYTLVGRRFDW